MKLGCNALFQLSFVILANAFLGCGGDGFSAGESEEDAGAQIDAADAGPDHIGKDASKTDVGHDVNPDSEASDEDVITSEAESDAIADAPEEPPTGICATYGHDGAIMLHPEMTLGPSAYLTVFGSFHLPPQGDGGSTTTPFEGWCWSAQGGQGEFDCFPKLGGNDAPATPKAEVTFQLGTNQTGSGPPNYYFCDFGVCPVTVTVCAGKVQACRWSNGTPTGQITYKEPGHNGKGELVCTLP